jgi:hypothetical protein
MEIQYCTALFEWKRQSLSWILHSISRSEKDGERGAEFAFLQHLDKLPPQCSGCVVHLKRAEMEFLIYSTEDVVSVYTVHTVGWVDFRLFYIFNKSTPEICYIPSQSTENSQN